MSATTRHIRRFAVVTLVVAIWVGVLTLAILGMWWAKVAFATMVGIVTVVFVLAVIWELTE